MNNVSFLFKRLVGHELIKGSFYIFIGSTIASLLAFFVNLFLVRSFSASDYGIYASLLSIFTLAGIPAQSLTPIIVKFSGDLIANKKLDQASDFYKKILFGVLLIVLFITLIFYLFSKSIGFFLHIDNASFVLITGISVSIFYVLTTNISFLQSALKFKFIAFAFTSIGITRLLFTVALVILGYEVLGAIWAIFLSSLIAVLLTLFSISKSINLKEKVKANINYKDIAKYSLVSSVAILSLASFTSTDVLLVKHFFNPHDAGLYGGLSLVGKVIFYFTMPIPAVMFPLIIKRLATGQRINILYYMSLALVVLPSLTITLFYYLFPNFTINFFLGGGEYYKIANDLFLFGIFLTIYSVLNLTVNFFLSVRVMKVFIPVLFGAILQIILISFFHSTFHEIILVSSIVTFIVLIILISYFLFIVRDQQKLKKKAEIVSALSI